MSEKERKKGREKIKVHNGVYVVKRNEGAERKYSCFSCPGSRGKETPEGEKNFGYL